jgi:ribonuclease HI
MTMSFSDMDMDILLNDNFSTIQHDNEATDILNESDDYLNQFNLIFFTDGSCLGNGKQDNRNKAGLGIYIVSNNENSQYHHHDNTKIIKKVNKDIILYNIYSYDIIYMNDIETTPSYIKCDTDMCTYYSIYSNHNDTQCSCKTHKTEDMILNRQFYQFAGTNIRAEGFAILYSLIYIKLLNIDNYKTKDALIKNFKIDTLTNIKSAIHPINFKLKSKNKYMIVTDSLFWINVITKWSNSWVTKFTILEKKNLDINILINYYMNILYNNQIEIVFQHIHGHADKNKNNTLNFYERGNVAADTLANMANKLKNNKVKII